MLQGANMTAYVLMTETFPAQERTVMSIAFQGFWGVGIVTVSGLGYLVRHWRHLELLLSLPNLLAIPCFWSVTHSVCKALFVLHLYFNSAM
jgi:OCT family organic cation transporter-like MFS transporter 4/5